MPTILEPGFDIDCTCLDRSIEFRRGDTQAVEAEGQADELRTPDIRHLVFVPDAPAAIP